MMTRARVGFTRDTRLTLRGRCHGRQYQAVRFRSKLASSEIENRTNAHEYIPFKFCLTTTTRIKRNRQGWISLPEKKKTVKCRLDREKSNAIVKQPICFFCHGMFQRLHDHMWPIVQMLGVSNRPWNVLI